MRVRQLIDLLLDQPMNNTVYIAGLDPLTGEREWDGEVQDVKGSGTPGLMATFIEFNETGLNNKIAEDNDD